MAADATMIGGARRCATTSIEVGLDGADPAIKLVQGVLTEWLHLWINNPKMRHKLATTWAKVKEKMQKCPKKERWRRLGSGPVANTIYTLLAWGWQPVSPLKWIDPEDEVW